jgi:hypothetical protein
MDASFKFALALLLRALTVHLFILQNRPRNSFQRRILGSTPPRQFLRDIPFPSPHRPIAAICLSPSSLPPYLLLLLIRILRNMGHFSVVIPTA